MVSVSFCTLSEKLLKENNDRLTDADTAAVRSAIVQVNQALQRNALSAIRRAIDDLKQSSQALSEERGVAARPRLLFHFSQGESPA